MHLHLARAHWMQARPYGAGLPPAVSMFIIMPTHRMTVPPRQRGVRMLGNTELHLGNQKSVPVRSYLMQRTGVRKVNVPNPGCWQVRVDFSGSKPRVPPQPKPGLASKPYKSVSIVYRTSHNKRPSLNKNTQEWTRIFDIFVKISENTNKKCYSQVYSYVIRILMSLQEVSQLIYIHLSIASIFP